MTPAIGFLIALIIGLTGVGGGTLTAPVLLLFLGLPAPLAVGTALAYVAVVKMFAVPVFIVRKQVNYRILLLLIAGGVPGAILGSLLLRRLHSDGLSGLLLVILGATVCFSASLNLFRKNPHAASIQRTERASILPWTSFPIGLEVGFSSAGAGALGTLALMHWTRLTSAEVVGTDLVFGLALAVAGGSIHLSAGGVEWATLQGLLLGGIPGAMAGSWLATRLPGGALRKALSVWLVYLGAQLLYRGIGVLAR